MTLFNLIYLFQGPDSKYSHIGEYKLVHNIHVCEMSRVGKLTKTEGRLIIARGWGDGSTGVAAKGCRVSF